MVSSGRPAEPCLLAIFPLSVEPTVRCTLRIANVCSTFFWYSIASFAISINWISNAPFNPWSCAIKQRRPTRDGTVDVCRIDDRSMPLAFQWSFAWRACSISTRPIMSSIFRNPSFAINSRTSSATKKKKLIRCSGSPLNFFRRSLSCVAIPTGHVFKWHLRIIMQPMAMSGMVANPNSSAPSNAAMTTSRPVCNFPSVCNRTRLRKSFITNTCCVSASPNSHGMPACLIDVSGDAPVPPLSPLMRIESACAFATPAATVPTPTSETSFTEIFACGFTLFKS